MKSYVLPFTFLLAYFSVYSQKVLQQSSQYSWRVEPVMGDYTNAHYNQYVESIAKGVIRLPNDQTIVTMRYAKDDFGIALLDKTGNVKWQTKIGKVILASFELEDKLIVLYTSDLPEPSYRGYVRTVFAAAIDPAKGTVLSTKELYKNSRKRSFDFKVHVSNDEKTAYLLVRHTLYKAQRFRGVETLSQSTAMELYSIKKDLEISAPQTINSKIIGTVFLACTKLPDGNLLLLSRTKNSVTVEKIDVATATITDQFSTPANFGDALSCYPHMKLKGNHLYLSLTFYRKYTPVVYLHDIDIEKKAITQHDYFR